MAPAIVSTLLQPRYVECINGVCRRRSRWSDVGRWIVLGAILFVALIVMFTCSCIARRRRRRGAQPMYGTGWMAPQGKFAGNNQPHNGQAGYPQQGYNPQGYGQQGYPPAPPAYGHQQQQHTGTTGTSFNPNDGYYGGAAPQNQQQNGVKQPPNAYQPEGAYAPPPGPPPGK